MFDSKNFSKTLKQNRITSVDLSIALQNVGIKLKKDAIDSYRKGKVQNPNINALQFTATLCKVTIIDFFDNREELKREITKNEINNNLDPYIKYLPSPLIPSNIKDIPVTKGYSHPLGNNILQEDSMNYATNIYIDKRMVKTAYQNRELKAVVMIGDSMSPYLKNDDVAIYHPLQKPKGDGNYVINTPHGLTVKKLKFFADGKIRLISENSHYNTMGNYDEEFLPADADLLEIFGLVVGRILKS